MGASIESHEGDIRLNNLSEGTTISFPVSAETQYFFKVASYPFLSFLLTDMPGLIANKQPIHFIKGNEFSAKNMTPFFPEGIGLESLGLISKHKRLRYDINITPEIELTSHEGIEALRFNYRYEEILGFLKGLTYLKDVNQFRFLIPKIGYIDLLRLAYLNVKYRKENNIPIYLRFAKIGQQLINGDLYSVVTLARDPQIKEEDPHLAPDSAETKPLWQRLIQPGTAAEI